MKSTEMDIVQYARTGAAVIALALGMGHGLIVADASAQAGAPVKTASLRLPDAEEPRVTRLPKLLSRRDVTLYRRVFELQEAGRWREADVLIKGIRNRMLMGHVRFQRLMHPTRYRSSYGELWTWMEAYADHPGARRIYRLAKRRQPEGWKSPRSPARAMLAPELESDPEPLTVRAGGEPRRRDAGRGAPALSREAREVRRTVQRWVSKGRVTDALRFLESRGREGLLDAVTFDDTLVWIARGYFVFGKDREALALAQRALARSNRRVPLACWWAGMAAWRLGKPLAAGDYFRQLAESRSVTPWLASAGGYWASRSYQAAGKPDRVVPMLRAAARYPRTFYGLLALTALRREPSLDFGMRRLNAADLEALLSMEPVRRALALIQVGEHVRAGDELRRYAHRLSPRMARVMLALASESGLADLSYRTAESLLTRTGVPVDAALFPLPVWEPDGGYTVDRAVVLAVMRQESKFRARIRSPRGARGLMQLMPRTASVMAGDRYRGARRHELMDPVLNVTLGQKYLRYLLSQEEIRGNLFFALAAYNSGPTKLRQWKRRVDYRDDPLLFIESIPSWETRIFIERVLSNMWIYRMRFGQPTHSLKSVVSGGWPRYVPMDPVHPPARS